MTEENRKVLGGGGLSFSKTSEDRKPAGPPASGAPPPAAAASKKVTIKSADMKDDMQKDAIDCALSAVEKHGVEKDIAEYIKKEFDKKYGATWHCIVGRNFGSYVTHETNHFVYFYLDQKAILLFKSG
ncbi:uncharacterized protein LOC131225397 [Magnolia sinica]|uniref:uncharacterized protein LOC131225397 n=1 Tax=Magnolia sinica TaxID=86752 RepID=UPI002658CC9D|nr:uncharacterized protein LOC131225397 [Magnolia sinica]